MREIEDIYKITYRSGADFIGTLRNERKFEYNQRVFIGSGYGEDIRVYPAIIKGLRDDRDDMNPAFIYDVQVPDWVVEQVRDKMSHLQQLRLSEIPWYKFRLRFRIKKFHKEMIDKKVEYKNLRCDRIFTSIEQAKDSVLQNHESMTRLNRKNIDRYFEQFDRSSKGEAQSS